MDETEFLDAVGPLTENTRVVNAVHDELVELATENDIPPSEFNKADVEALAENIIDNGTTSIQS